MPKDKKKLFQTFKDAETEEELKFLFAKYFKLRVSTKNRVDLYSEQILFEFKLDSNLKNPQILAKVVAQSLYYIRKLHFGYDERPISQNICIVTKNFAAFFPTDTFSDFYTDKILYDWDLAPSNPCKILVNALSAFQPLIHAKIFDFANVQDDIAFATLINHTRKPKSNLFNLKKPINENNFYQIFLYWQSLFGTAVKNSHKPSEYFITDIEKGKSAIVENKSVLFRMNDGERIEKPINIDDYKFFWSRYDKISNTNTIIAIRQRMDCLTEINLRRYTGEFYTPLRFADKAFDYLIRTVGEWWQDPNFRLWDMAAGTGNLEFAIWAKFPDAIKSCYLSTLIDDEADYCNKLFPDATAFQFDFLNDDASKLPKNLQDDLNNPDIRWIIFINPPYATANNKKITNPDVDKSKISITAIRELMNAENLGEVSRELFSQFIYRISRDFSGKIAYLGIFSKIKYLNANADKKFRDKVFDYKYERGFIFDSKCFEGCKASFPVGFLIWNLSEHISLDEQEISLDVYNSAVEKFAEKIFHAANRDDTLNKWIERPRRTKKFPPMTSAFNVCDGKIRCDKVSEDFLADLMCIGNDFVHQNYTAILPGVYAGGCELSITEKNFEQAMIIHMVRRLPKATWLNDRDQFMQPTKELPEEFIVDAVVWSLFSASNQTVSLRNVEYEGKIYEVRNNFYPFLLSELKSWEISTSEMRWQINSAREDRYAAKYLSGKRLSEEALQILALGRELYKKFYMELERLDVCRWKIEDWDAGFYQIRMSLGETLNLRVLSDKLLPQIYELGFLRDEVRYF